MKKLKLTIAGEVKTFDLPENGEYKCEVTEFYIPKEGDCVRVESKVNNVLYWCKLTDATTTSVNFKIFVNSRLEILTGGCFDINNTRIYTKITPEELKAKYAEAGYDWDYESDTITPIKWVPKEGNKVWFLDVCMKPVKIIFSWDDDFHLELLEKGLLFQTEEDCQKFAEHCMKYINKNK